MNIVICDDNPKIVDVIEEHLITCLEKNNIRYKISKFYHPKDIFKYDVKNFDVFFMDITYNKYDKLNGIDYSVQIREQNKCAEIIFVSNNSAHLEEVCKVKPFSFLFKTRIPNLIDHLVDRLISEFENNLDIVDEYMNIENIANGKKQILKIELKKIKYIKSEAKKQIIYMLDGTKYITSKSLNIYEKHLNRLNFLRCHNSYIVNMSYAKLGKNNNLEIEGHLIPISRKKVSTLKERFNTFS